MAFSLHLLGSFRLVGSENRLIALPERARALIAYLAGTSAPIPRHVLAELLSAEGTEQDQRTALRQAIYLARKAMGDSAVICPQEGSVSLNEALVTTDLRRFMDAIAHGDDRSLEDAVDLYGGPFLDGEKSPSPSFEAWLVARRRDLLEHALTALLRLAGSDVAAGDHGRALARLRRALALDPLREDVHRQVMRSLAAMGQRSNALRHYETARKMLAEEFGVPPESETVALRNAIASGAPSDLNKGTVPLLPANRDVAMGDVLAEASGTTAGALSSPARAVSPGRAAGGGWLAAHRLALTLATASLLVLSAGLSLRTSAPSRPSPTALVGGSSAEPAPQLSIVVLPFANLGSDPDQEYFADGITDDLTSDLSRIDGSFVISRDTAFTYKGRYVDAREAGRELGVRYVLEGSVRRAGEQVYVNSHLIDAATAQQVWAERLEGSRGDLSALHNEVTGRIAATLRLELVEAEGRRVEQDHRPDPTASDDALRGWAILYRPYSHENRAEARSLFDRALDRDPNDVSALIGLAQVLANARREGDTSLAIINAAIDDRQRAETLLRRALDLEPNRAATYFVLGMLRRSQGRIQEASDAFRTAIALDRNYARAYLYLGMTLMHLGHPDETIALAQHAMRLNPRDPNIADHFWILGSALALLGRTDEAIANLQEACRANPRLWYMHMYLAAAYGMANRIDEAKLELAEQLRLRPQLASLAAIKAAIPQINAPTYLALAEQTVFIGLLRAGLPEHDPSLAGERDKLSTP